MLAFGRFVLLLVLIASAMRSVVWCLSPGRRRDVSPTTPVAARPIPRRHAAPLDEAVPVVERRSLGTTPTGMSSTNYGVLRRAVADAPGFASSLQCDHITPPADAVATADMRTLGQER
jgi:hypothetical protein